MDRRDVIKAGIGLGLAGAAMGCLRFNRIEKKASKRPNVLWIIMDDCRADALGCYGKSWPQTPNMDQIARQGVRFKTAIVQSPVCVPSRSSMDTGLYCNDIGITAMGKLPAITPEYMKNAKKNAPTFLQSWKSAGIDTFNVGKLHAYENDWINLGDTEPQFGGGGEIIDIGTKYNLKDKDHNYPEVVTKTHKWAIGGRVPLKPEQMRTWKLGDLAINKLEDLVQKKDPFFFRVSFHAPHIPCVVPESYFIDPAKINLPLPTETELATKPKFERNNIQIYSGAPNLTKEQIGIARGTYYGMVSLVDVQVGRIMNILRRHNLVDNTIVVINSDQGFQLGEHGFWKKRCFYEQNVCVPFILSCPNLLPENKVIEDPIEMIDMFPTLADLTRVSIPNDISGQSLMPLIKGDVKQWRPACFCEHDYSGDVYDELRKDGGRCVMVRTKEWKLIYFMDERLSGKDEKLYNSLYNLKVDPNEKNNLFNENKYKDVIKHLKNIALNFD